MDKRYNYYVRPYLEESILEKIKRITLNIIKSIAKFVTDIWSKLMQKIKELKQRFKDNPKVQSLLNKINNSRIMQTLVIAKRNKPKVERSGSVEEINKCKEEVEGARKTQEEEVENAKKILEQIKENDEDLDPILQTISNVAKNKDIKGIRRVLVIAIQNDQNFEKGYFDINLNYALKHVSETHLFESYDKKPLISNSKKEFNRDDYINAIYELKNNFCKERIADVKKIGQYVY